MRSLHEKVFAITGASRGIGAATARLLAREGCRLALGGRDAAPTEIKGVRQGTVYALVVQNPFRMGYDGVNAAVRMVRTGADVKGQDAGATYVTKQNIDTPEVQGVLNPSCKNPPV